MALTQVTPDVIHNVQSNITQVGTLGNLTVSGNVNAGNVSATNLTGALLTASQTNITGLGTITTGTWSADTIAVNKGGTGSTSTSGALDNLLPSGEISGYVLSTSGPGSYYWAAQSGGGSTVGSQIAISRTTYTATAGQSVFSSTGTYTIGSNQLRVFINGVRQFPSEYTETSTTSFTMSTGLAAGDVVMAEVDSYQNYTIYANAVVSSAVGGISATNVQNALAELDTEKASLSGATFTGNITAGNVTATNLAGAITSSQVTTALGFTPYNSTNPNGYITGINSSQVTTALGFTPYNSTNPSGFLSVGIGIGQTWQDVIGSRSAGVTYTNSTGKPIMVGIRTQGGAYITVDGVITSYSGINNASNFLGTIVPNGSSYYMTGAVYNWAELR